MVIYFKEPIIVPLFLPRHGSVVIEDESADDVKMHLLTFETWPEKLG
jgi:hypothetical protein